MIPCYVYEHADQSWRSRLRVLAVATAKQVAAQIAGHVQAHRAPWVSVVLHGGDSLLAGPERLEAINLALRGGLAGRCDLDLRVHTNGIRLGEDFCAIFRNTASRSGFPLTLPGRATTFLMHEFQHVKLGAVLVLLDLYDPADSGQYHAPRRKDPRSLEGLLQGCRGAYAHIAVTDFWRVRRSYLTGEEESVTATRLTTSASLWPHAMRCVAIARKHVDTESAAGLRLASPGG